MTMTNISTYGGNFFDYYNNINSNHHLHFVKHIYIYKNNTGVLISENCTLLECAIQ